MSRFEAIRQIGFLRMPIDTSRGAFGDSGISKMQLGSNFSDAAEFARFLGFACSLIDAQLLLTAEQGSHAFELPKCALEKFITVYNFS